MLRYFGINRMIPEVPTKSDPKEILSMLYSKLILAPKLGEYVSRTDSPGTLADLAFKEQLNCPETQKILHELSQVERCSSRIEGQDIFFERSNDLVYLLKNEDLDRKSYQEVYYKKCLGSGQSLHVLGAERKRTEFNGGSMDIAVYATDESDQVVDGHIFNYETKKRFNYGPLLHVLAELSYVAGTDMKEIVSKVVTGLLEPGDQITIQNDDDATKPPKN